jgi:hypothetical protein
MLVPSDDTCEHWGAGQREPKNLGAHDGNLFPARQMAGMCNTLVRAKRSSRFNAMAL